MPRNSRKTLTEPNPLYALAGAGDLAVEKIREFSKIASDKLGSLESTDPAAVSDRVQERIEERADQLAGALRTASTDIRSQAKGFGEKAQTVVQSAVQMALIQAGDTYDTLTTRGKVAVIRIRTQQNGRTANGGRQINRTAGTAAKSASTATRKRPATKGRNSSTSTGRKSTRTASNGSTKPSTARTSAAKSSPAKTSAAKPAAKSTTAKKSTGSSSPNRTAE